MKQKTGREKGEKVDCGLTVDLRTGFSGTSDMVIVICFFHVTWFGW